MVAEAHTLVAVDYRKVDVITFPRSRGQSLSVQRHTVVLLLIAGIILFFFSPNLMSFT